ncbi:PEGA domain-containing protein [Patescibacteria group bacterium]|nr:PEGA domain-containing protein [Patescibacteria group bacterium]
MFRILAQVFSIAIFVGVFLFSLFITYGYRYDFEENQVVQTSVIDVCMAPKQADLYLDDEFYSSKACDKIFGLNLGTHSLEVKKDGYFSWNKNIYLDNEKVSLYSQILLIPKPEYYMTTVLEEGVEQVWVSPNQSRYAAYDKAFDVIKIFSASGSATIFLETPAEIMDVVWVDNNNLVTDTTDGRYEVNVNKGDWQLADEVSYHPRTIESDLIIKGNELWVMDGDEEIFITRYSGVIESAQYFYNESNLLITTENDVRICDFEGENCHVITNKDEGTPVAYPARSKKIIFVKNGTLKQLTLNGPSGNYLEMNL